MMLTGVPPFETADESDTRFQLVRTGKIRKMVKDWGLDRFSEEATIVLEGLLTVDVNKRMTLDRVWTSRWLHPLGLRPLPAGAAKEKVVAAAAAAAAGAGARAETETQAGE